jgi:very-short-patch-repair endonuclease
MAATLSCGPEALLSHRSAAALWGLIERGPKVIDLVVPSHLPRHRPGIRIHRRSRLLESDRWTQRSIPVTSPAATLIDLATQLGDDRLEGAVNAADRLGLIDPEALHDEVEGTPSRPGVGRLGRLLDRFTRTDSGLERRFLALVRRAGLPTPQTQAIVDGVRVDFYWPQFGLIVETDGLRYHRTPIQQSHDLRRDQAHIAAGLKALRFPAVQIRDEPSQVISTLMEVMAQTPAFTPERLSPLEG